MSDINDRLASSVRWLLERPLFASSEPSQACVADDDPAPTYVSFSSAESPALTGGVCPRCQSLLVRERNTVRCERCRRISFLSKGR